MSLPFSIDKPEGADQPTDPPHRGDGLPGRLRRFLPRTLAGRLMVGVVALVVLLVLLIGVATYTLLAPFLTERVDEQLSSVAQRSNIEAYVDYAAEPPSSSLPGAQDIWFVVFGQDGSGQLQVQDDLLIHPLNLAQSDRVELAGHPNSYRTVTTTDGVKLRVIPVSVQYQIVNIVGGRRVPTGPVISGVAVVGLSMHDVDSTLSRLVRLELILGVAAIAVAAGLTAWGVRAGLRPLHRVTRTAQEVTAELSPEGSGLDRRVPVTNAPIEVQQVASSVNTLLQAVQTEFAARVASEERMRQFLADASHELRTPLTSIRGYAELSRLQSASGEAADDSMRRIEVEGTRMSRLVEDLLVLARGDQGGLLEVAEVSVDALLEEAAIAVHGAHPDRTIEVGRPTGLAVLGDWDQLVRVLINLTTNAAMHTSEGPIRLVAAPSSVAGGPTGLLPAVALQVSDTGPGLPPEEAAHVFERFWRADKARSRAKGGSGLGMAIVAQIVQAHGGWVRFDSSVEHGTTVTVTLPGAVAPYPGQPAYQDEPYPDEPYSDEYSDESYSGEPYSGEPAARPEYQPGYQGPPAEYPYPPPAVPTAGSPGPVGPPT